MQKTIRTKFCPYRLFASRAAQKQYPSATPGLFWRQNDLLHPAAVLLGSTAPRCSSTWIYCTPPPLRNLLGSTAIPCEFYLDLLHNAANSTWIYCTPLRILLHHAANSTWIYCTPCEFYLDLLHPPANSTWIYCTALRILLGSTAPRCEFYLDLLHPL